MKHRDTTAENPNMTTSQLQERVLEANPTFYKEYVVDVAVV